MKRIKVDDTLSNLKEKVRRLRDEVARRGFRGQTATGTGELGEEGGDNERWKEGGVREKTTGSVTGSSIACGTEDCKKEEHAKGGKSTGETSTRAQAKHVEFVNSTTAADSASLPLAPALAGLVRDDGLVGGVRLASTSMEPVDKEYKLKVLKATAPREKKYREIRRIDLPLVVERKRMFKELVKVAFGDGFDDEEQE